MATEGCYFVSVWGKALGWTHLLPWAVTIALAAGSLNRDSRGRWGKQFFVVLYGLYLHAWQYVLWVFQNHFAVPRPDPYCGALQTYAFPSQEGFYIAALIAFVVTYTFLWNIGLPWAYWAFFWVFLAALPGALVWFQYNLWWEVLFSMALGTVVSGAYVIVFRVYLLESVPLLLHQAPWRWLGCNDSWCLTERQLDFAYSIQGCLVRSERVIAARARGQRRFS